MATIIMLQKKIAKALESGEDTAPLLRELAELRIKLNRAVKSRPLKSRPIKQGRENGKPDEPRLVYAVEEVAEMLQISRNLAYVLCRQRKIPGVILLGPKRMMVSAKVINEMVDGIVEWY